MADDTIDLDWSNESVKEAGSRTLVGRVMTKRNLNRGTVKSMILKAWNLKNGVQIVDGENGCFLFSFEDYGECARVLRDRPWLILSYLLIVQERALFVSICDLLWNRSPYWIQIHGIPIEGFTDENILKIGARIGEVIEYERPIVNGVVVRYFLRIRVWIKIDEMLMDGFRISRHGLGKCWIMVKYEKLQVFCYKCGVVSHDSRDCDKEKVMSAVNPEEARFGGWIGTLPCRNDVDILQCAEMEGVEMEHNMEYNGGTSTEEVCVEKLIVLYLLCAVFLLVRVKEFLIALSIMFLQEFLVVLMLI